MQWHVAAWLHNADRVPAHLRPCLLLAATHVTLCPQAADMAASVVPWAAAAAAAYLVYRLVRFSR